MKNFSQIRAAVSDRHTDRQTNKQQTKYSPITAEETRFKRVAYFDWNVAEKSSVMRHDCFNRQQYNWGSSVSISYYYVQSTRSYQLIVDSSWPVRAAGHVRNQSNAYVRVKPSTSVFARQPFATPCSAISLAQLVLCISTLNILV